jgi:hypothetical protein
MKENLQEKQNALHVWQLLNKQEILRQNKVESSFLNPNNYCSLLYIDRLDNPTYL